jgi:hypothetical protein
VLKEVALATKPKALEESYCGRVSTIDDCLDAVEVQDVEREAKRCCRGLSGKTPALMVAAEREANLAQARIGGLNEEADVADELIVGFEANGELRP